MRLFGYSKKIELFSTPSKNKQAVFPFKKAPKPKPIKLFK